MYSFKCSYMFKAQQRVRTIFTIVSIASKKKFHILVIARMNTCRKTKHNLIFTKYVSLGKIVERGNWSTKFPFLTS